MPNQVEMGSGAKETARIAYRSRVPDVLSCMKHKVRQRAFGFVSWGGKRRGAGRKPAGRCAGVSHAVREKLATRFPVLVTMRMRPGLLSLRADDTYALLRVAFVAGSHGRFRVVEYSIQSNHLHLLVESSGKDELSRGMTGLAVRVARGLNKLWKRVGSVFLDRFHSRVLRTPRAVRVALVYVLQNARKHGAWIAGKPDVYSSGPEFGGWHDRKGADSSSGPLPRARTWLLSIGWRRHGRIRVTETPGRVRARAVTTATT